MEPHEIRLVGGPRDGERMTIPGSTYVYGIIVFEQFDAAAARRAYLETGMNKPVVNETTRYYRHARHGDVWLHETLMPAYTDSIETKTFKII